MELPNVPLEDIKPEHVSATTLRRRIGYNLMELGARILDKDARAGVTAVIRSGAEVIHRPRKLSDPYDES